MDAASQGLPGVGNRPIQITERVLLVVEGRDEQLFFTALMQHMGQSGIQVLPVGGKTQLAPNLAALVRTVGFADVCALGIVRDADQDAQAAFQSVCEALRAAGLPVPLDVLQLAGDSPYVIVMIVPGNGRTGSLEDLCLQAVQPDPAMRCVARWLECLEESGLPVPASPSKAQTQVFLASRPKVPLRVGEAASAGYWPFDQLAFQQVSEFLEHLLNAVVLHELVQLGRAFTP